MLISMINIYIGAAREAERDIIYRGYHIPAGSVILTNTWYVTCYTLLSVGTKNERLF
jgi:hypothetical protein